MIDKGKDRVNRVMYDGYIINRIYGCDGLQVYDRSEERYGCDTLYLEDYSGGTYTIQCMRDSCDFLGGHSIKNLIYRHDGIEETITFLNAAQERSITSITMGDCVTTLDNSVFANWSGVTEVTLPPYLVAIYGGGSYGTFYNCKSLKSITFPQHLGAIYNAFENCSSLSSVTFNDELKHIGANSFYGCSSLTDVEMPNSVVEVGIAAFNGCTSLSSVTLSSGITEIEEHTFEGCSSLTDIVLPNNVTVVRSSSFSQCTSLSSLTLNEGLSEVEEGCIDGCFNLKSLTFPSTFSTFTYGEPMFSNTGVESVTFLNPTPPIVYHGSGTIGDVFVNASQLTKIYVPCDALTTYKNAWASEGTWLTNKLHPIQGSCPYPTYDFVVEYKYNYQGQDYDYVRRASDCHSLDPDASTLLEQETRIYANCTYVSNFNTLINNVTVGDAVNIISNNCYNGWSALTEASISMDVNTIYGNAFYNCPNLKKVNLYAITPPNLYGNTTIFSGTTNCLIYVPCSSLEAYRNSSDWAYLRSRIRPMDEFCEVQGKYRLTLNDLTTVTADCTSTVIDRNEVGGYSGTCVSVALGDCLTEIGNNAFDNFKITEVNIPNNVTNIGDYAFLYCGNLTSLTIGNNVTNIGDSAFFACSGLTSINLPDSVVSIGRSSFSMCRALTAVTIGSGCTHIGTYGQYTYTFYNCPNLNSVTIKAVTPPEVGTGAFNGMASNYVIYVPSQSVSAYKNARGWATYASHIQAIPS